MYVTFWTIKASICHQDGWLETKSTVSADFYTGGLLKWTSKGDGCKQNIDGTRVITFSKYKKHTLACVFSADTISKMEIRNDYLTKQQQNVPRFDTLHTTERDSVAKQNSTTEFVSLKNHV